MKCENCKNEPNCKECEKEAFKRLSALGEARCSGYEPETMPNKLTDAEIKKAFECCCTDKGGCDECPYYSREENRCIEDADFFHIPNKTLDLINRLQGELFDKTEQLKTAKAEVERLKANEEMAEGYADALVEYTKAEAYKEFAELVHCHCESIINQEWNKKVSPVSWADAYKEFDNEVDNLLNELVGDTDGKDV